MESLLLILIFLIIILICLQLYNSIQVKSLVQKSKDIDDAVYRIIELMKKK